MWALRLGRVVAWTLTLGISILYWAKLGPLLHSSREYEAAFIIFLCVLAGTVVVCGMVLRVLFKRTVSDLSAMRSLRTSGGESQAGNRADDGED